MFTYIFILLQSSGPPPPDDWGDPDLPIDNGIWILLAICILLGSYKLYKSRRISSNAP